MSLRELCHQAWINLKAAKLRSCLALLGILVGTASVVALVSSGQLATEKALAQFKALGTDLLAISVFQNQNNAKPGSGVQIPLQAWRQLPQHIPYIRDIAPYGQAYQAMSYGGRTLQGSIIAADEALSRIIHIRLAQGHFVSFVDSYEHFCVIGAGIAKQLQRQSLDSPMGKTLRIGKTLYTVIGIAKPWQENVFFNEDINQAVIIPLAGMALVNPDSKISNAIMQLKAESPIDSVIEDIKHWAQGISSQLTVFPRSAKQIISGMESQGRIFTNLLAVIGSISLLVGGIGIMNVMLVSVTERKKEIGIRKAVGAKNRDIHALFLTESVLLSLCGGLLGVVFGLSCTGILAFINDWVFTLYGSPILAGLFVSLATGIFFGLYPARRASKLEPVVSLRGD